MLSPQCLPKPSYGPITTLQQRNGFYNNERSKLGAAGEMVMSPRKPSLQIPEDLYEELSRASVKTPKSKGSKRYDEITYVSMRSKSSYKSGKTGRTGKSAFTRTTTRSTRDQL